MGGIKTKQLSQVSLISEILLYNDIDHLVIMMMQLGGPGLAWSVLAVLLLVTSVGVSSIINMIIIIILTIISVTITFFLTLFANTTVDYTPLCSRLAARAPVIERKSLMSVSRPRSQAQSTMTGCEAVDKPIQDMISFIIRDYVLSWYSKISANDRFPGKIICFEDFLVYT